jgi:hypothetical protein
MALLASTCQGALHGWLGQRSPAPHPDRDLRRTPPARDPIEETDNFPARQEPDQIPYADKRLRTTDNFAEFLQRLQGIRPGTASKGSAQ